MEYGHWNIKNVLEFNPEEWFGFVYQITEKDTGKKYIGKKQFHFTRRVKRKGLKNRKVVIKESDWKTYTGSSTHLNRAIAEKGLNNYEFEILSLHESKASLYYQEVHLQITRKVMLDSNYYNSQIGSVKFKVPLLTEMEQKYNCNKDILYAE